MTDAATSTPWRKRHPVLARAVLYGLGVLGGVIGLWLLAHRRAQDTDDRLLYLWKRLEALPIVIQADPDAPEALKALDSEYADPALPAPLRARAERMRGIIARNRKDRSGVDAAYERALALDPATGAATRIEWALCLTDLKDGVAARKQLLAVRTTSVTLGLWADLASAQAERVSGGPAAGAGLARESLLSRAPTPLPAEAPLWLGLADWTPAGAALEATRWKVGDLSVTSAQARAAWLRLAELAPADFEALSAVAEALLAAEDPDGARRAWAGAQAADPGAAARALALRRALAPLQTR